VYKENRDRPLIFFGDKTSSLSMMDIKQSRFSLSLQNLVQDFGLQSLVVLEQVHGIDGVVIDQAQSEWFSHQGDFLVTNQKGIALVVVTADCIPLILYDRVHQAVAMVHAGWKGLLAGVAFKAIQAMQQQYQTNISDLIVTFGPSARVCCYEVSQGFVNDFLLKFPEILIKQDFFSPHPRECGDPSFKLSEIDSRLRGNEVRDDFEFKSYIFCNRDGKIFFDKNLFLQGQLKKFGIAEQNIYTNNALCTICNPEFCSFRRQKEAAGRQVSIVALW
jgi:YfiH family protein